MHLPLRNEVKHGAEKLSVAFVVGSSRVAAERRGSSNYACSLGKVDTSRRRKQSSPKFCGNTASQHTCSLCFSGSGRWLSGSESPRWCVPPPQLRHHPTRSSHLPDSVNTLPDLQLDEGRRYAVFASRHGRSHPARAQLHMQPNCRVCDGDNRQSCVVCSAEHHSRAIFSARQWLTTLGELVRAARSTFPQRVCAGPARRRGGSTDGPGCVFCPFSEQECSPGDIWACGHGGT